MSDSTGEPVAQVETPPAVDAEQEKASAEAPASEANAPSEEAPVASDAAPAEGATQDPEFSNLHPLQRAWTMWYDNPGGRSNPKNWFENIKRIITFGTIEEFWCTFNNIMPPSRLQNGSNYHLFTDHINPMWEDENNRHGGKWVVVFPKGRREIVDEYWLHILLALIGEAFEDTDEICGAVASLRKSQSKIAIWTRNANNEDAVRFVASLNSAVPQILR